RFFPALLTHDIPAADHYDRVLRPHLRRSLRLPQTPILGPGKKTLAGGAKATEGEPWQQVIATNCAAAVDAGCDDPMILYLFVKFSMAHTNDAAGFSRAYCRVAQAMEKSSYPPVRKFYA